MMDKRKTAETMLEVLQRGALVGPDEKQELWVSALVAGLEAAVRLNEQSTADRLHEALKTVKDYCASRGDTCKGCLLNTDLVYGGCDFMDENPQDWDLGFLKDGDSNGKE